MVTSGLAGDVDSFSLAAINGAEGMEDGIGSVEVGDATAVGAGDDDDFIADDDVFSEVERQRKMTVTTREEYGHSGRKGLRCISPRGKRTFFDDVRIFVEFKRVSAIRLSNVVAHGRGAGSFRGHRRTRTNRGDGVRGGTHERGGAIDDGGGGATSRVRLDAGGVDFRYSTSVGSAVFMRVKFDLEGAGK